MLRCRVQNGPPMTVPSATPLPDARLHGHIDRRLCVAPMMDRTDRFDRYLLRLITPRALLYTEMLTAPALLHGNADSLLRHHPSEQPVALQVGGGGGGGRGGIG